MNPTQWTSKSSFSELSESRCLVGFLEEDRALDSICQFISTKRKTVKMRCKNQSSRGMLDSIHPMVQLKCVWLVNAIAFQPLHPHLIQFRLQKPLEAVYNVNKAKYDNSAVLFDMYSLKTVQDGIFNVLPQLD